MKKLFIHAVLICAIVAPALTAAQTYFKPFNLTTSTENVSFTFPNGDTFNGHRFDNILNGQITAQSYYGTYTKPNGDKFITQKGGDGFKVVNNNFGFYNGAIWYLDTDNRLYCMIFRNGVKQSQTEEHRSHYFNGNYLVITTDYGTGGGSYNSGGTYNGGSGSSGSSTYDRHKATCGGCKGTGLCQHCHGTGYVNNYKSKCSLCHGTGKCVSCHGNGFIRGSY